MKNALPLLLGGGAILLLTSSSKRPAISSKKKAKACPPLQPGSGSALGYDYIEFTTGGASLNERLPIIFFFHCLGCRPDTLVKHIEDLPVRARVIMPTGNSKYGSNPAWWTLRSKTKSQEELAQMMDQESARMQEFVETMNDCLAGVGRPIITGYSQGGMMTYALAARSPDTYKAAVPVAGWLPVDLWPNELPETYAVHGTKDSTVKYSRTKDFIEQMDAKGMPVTFYPVSGIGHSLSGDLKGTWKDLVEYAVEA